MASNKKFGPLGWLVIGCFAFLILMGIGFTACTWFVGKKVKDIAEEVVEDPVKAVELAIEYNPDLELVERHEDGRLTVRNVETGEVTTVDWTDIKDGKLKVTTDEGTVEIGGEEGFQVTEGEGAEAEAGAVEGEAVAAEAAAEGDGE